MGIKNVCIVLTLLLDVFPGKSTTIQRFFDCAVYNPENDRTRWISEYTKEVRATAEDPRIIGQLKFIDFPGALDEDPEKHVENFARFKLVRNKHPELRDRDPGSTKTF